MPSLTVENYLKAALQTSMRTGREWVGTGEFADALGVLPGTVTSMLKTLDESHLVEYQPYKGARLRDAGRKLAMRVLRRHRLIELFLVQTLGLSWDQVHEEAEHMEHAVSDFLIDRMDEYLGRPPRDPHGDPIPTVEGEFRTRTGTAVRLSECGSGTRIRLVRVTNQESDFLRYLSDAGVKIGSLGTVKENNPAAGLIAVELEGRPVSISHSAAEALWVEAEMREQGGKRDEG
jgi:DtxR family transcriptional regulator, Mn-dependent transcriptional regulator